MADFRAFLKPTAPLVLPYFGGARVDAPDRRLRIDTDLEPGWYRFEVQGRRAVATEPAEPTDLSKLPAVRGHWVDGWVVQSGREIGRLALPLLEEPDQLTRVTARRWYSGQLLFDTVEFEDSAEQEARTALQSRADIARVAHVVPSLRAAFAYALGRAVARERNFVITLPELSAHVVTIADGGVPAAQRLFDLLDQQRRARAAERRARMREDEAERYAAHLLQVARGDYARARRGGSAEERVTAALDAANATMLACRRVGENLDVTYDVDGVRLISLVDGRHLTVLDPGMCIYDEGELTLDAMPSVIREAVRDGVLNIWRHG